jgi:hypothetical protein
MVQSLPLQMPCPLPLLGAGQFMLQALQVPSAQVAPFSQSASVQQPLWSTQPLAHSFCPAEQPGVFDEPPASPAPVPAEDPCMPLAPLLPPAPSVPVGAFAEQALPSNPKASATTDPKVTHVRRFMSPSEKEHRR